MDRSMQIRRDLAASWQPIETAPKDGSRILLWTDTRALADQTYIETICDGEHFAVAQIGVWERCYDGSIGWSIERIGEATHWMPLPPPPGSEEG